MPKRTARSAGARSIAAFCCAVLVAGALAGIGSAPAALAPGDLPPNLVADPVTDVVLTTDSGAGPDRLLLRFAGYIHNAGPGPIEIWGVRSSSSLPMSVTQRIFNGSGGWRDDPSPAQLIYETADGHNHWHLMHAARYSLWDSARSAEVAPAMKVGFCLEDSEHVDQFGPAFVVYGGSRDHHFCEERRPNALNAFQGVSSGWRDEYDNELAFQWIDASAVQPGSYWLRSDVDPDGVITESDEANQPAWAGSQTTIPGHVAQPLEVHVSPGAAATVTRQVQSFGSPGAAQYRIESGPAHGSLDAVAGVWSASATVLYTPQPGFQGVDTFTYSARDSSSAFPSSPAVATVTLRVGTPPSPAVQISGAPDAMIAATSVQLRASVANDSPGVTWSVNGSPGGAPARGTITAGGLYTAPARPPSDGAVVIGARSAAGGYDERRVRIDPVPARRPAPLPPASGSSAHGKSTARLTRPQAIRVGHMLILTTVPARSGVVRLSAYRRGRPLGTCASRTPGGRRFTCRVRLRRSYKAVTVVASLRVGGRVVAVRKRAASLVHGHGGQHHAAASGP
jgi:hypothetical protein